MYGEGTLRVAIPFLDAEGRWWLTNRLGQLQETAATSELKLPAQATTGAYRKPTRLALPEAGLRDIHCDPATARAAAWPARIRIAGLNIILQNSPSGHLTNEIRTSRETRDGRLNTDATTPAASHVEDTHLANTGAGNPLPTECCCHEVRIIRGETGRGSNQRHTWDLGTGGAAKATVSLISDMQLAISIVANTNMSFISSTPSPINRQRSGIAWTYHTRQAGGDLGWPSLFGAEL